MSANGWDSDETAGTAGNESAEAGRTPGAWDMAASQAESAPGPLVQGPLTQDPLVPGLAVQSPALDYMFTNQRRRMRHVATVAASILAIVVVAAVVAVAAHSGPKKAGPVQLTAAQIVQRAATQQEGVNSESATMTEQIEGQANATIAGTVELQRQPLLMAMNLHLNVTGTSEAMRAILTDSAMYLKLGNMPGMPSYLAAKWLKIPLTGLGPSSLFASLEHEVQNENPAAQFAALRAASHLHAAGTQVVSGVSTTKYTGSYAPAAAVKAMPAALRTALAPYLNLVKGNVDFSVWIDSSHYVRKYQATESVGGATVLIESTYGSFNQPVKIALPRSSKVISPPASALNA